MAKGEIVSLVGENALIKGFDELPKIGSPVYIKAKRIGKISDIIGSVDKPYVVLKKAKNCEVHEGDIVRVG